MNVFLIGTGGREHAIAWKIAQSPLLKTLFCLKGNPKIEDIAQIVDCDPQDSDAIINFCQTQPIDLVIIGPEAFLVAGLADKLREAEIAVVGPSKAAAEIEGSKIFAKEFCQNFSIPTAKYAAFDQEEKALAYLSTYTNDAQNPFPLVIKADGLAQGKGVTIAQNEEEAIEAIHQCFQGSFGEAGKKIIIEEFLQGEEVSFFCLCDGTTAIPLGSAQDYKRLLDHDLGPNTGGMGAISPAIGLNLALYEEIIQEIIIPTIEGLQQIGRPFQGILFAGLMLTATGPKLLEYNVRFGDPEAQALLPLFAKDFLLFLKASATGQLAQITRHTIYSKLPDPQLFQKNQYAITIVMATANYPNNPAPDGYPLGLQNVENEENIIIFHAGTEKNENSYYSKGGRTLNITAYDSDLEIAQEKAYRAVKRVDWPKGIYRHDIGTKAIKKLALQQE